MNRKAPPPRHSPLIFGRLLIGSNVLGQRSHRLLRDRIPTASRGRPAGGGWARRARRPVACFFLPRPPLELAVAKLEILGNTCLSLSFSRVVLRPPSLPHLVLQRFLESRTMPPNEQDQSRMSKSKAKRGPWYSIGLERGMLSPSPLRPAMRGKERLLLTMPASCPVCATPPPTRKYCPAPPPGRDIPARHPCTCIFNGSASSQFTTPHRPALDILSSPRDWSVDPSRILECLELMGTGRRAKDRTMKSSSQSARPQSNGHGDLLSCCITDTADLKEWRAVDVGTSRR